MSNGNLPKQKANKRQQHRPFGAGLANARRCAGRYARKTMGKAMSKYRFEVQYKDHHGEVKKRVVEIEEENNDLDQARTLAEFRVKSTPVDRDPRSFKSASVIEILSVEEVKDET